VKDYLKFRSALQSFARQFDGNGSIQTPCGANVSPTKAHAIMEIGATNGKCLNQKELATLLGLNKSNISRLIQSLEKSSFIKRVISDSDKRALLLELTAKGKKMCKRLELSSKKYIEELLGHIPKSKHKDLIETLEVLNRANSLLKEVKNEKNI